MEKVLAYDLGGTKVEAGIVAANGRVLASKRVPVEFAKGKTHVINQIAQLGLELMKEHKGVKRVGLASAGPLHPAKGLLLNPINFRGNDGSWGRTPIVKILEKKLKKKVILENDAAAAVLAEAWLGAGKNSDGVLMITLGTGLGTGIVNGGELVRAGQGLHTEGGHLIINFQETHRRCGCGNFGCAEAYLSGHSFQTWASEALGDLSLKAEDLATMARGDQGSARAQFDKYGEILAHFVYNYVILYAPETVVFSGSFAKAADLFMPATERTLEQLLERQNQVFKMTPKLKLSTLKNQAGMLGAAYSALKK